MAGSSISFHKSKKGYGYGCDCGYGMMVDDVVTDEWKLHGPVSPVAPI